MNEYNPFSLKGKNILVTGASSGIGRSTAIECSKMGATLVISGRNEERLADTFSQLAGEGHQFVSADLNHEDEVLKLVDQCISLDGVVHSAGIMSYAPLLFIDSEKIEKMMKINFVSPLLLTRYLLKKKKVNKKASIVFVSSLAVNCATIGNGIYSATKGAIDSISNVMALELSQKKVRVNCLLPGMVETELIEGLGLTTEEFEKDKQRYPLGYGKPEDVAYAALYLLSDAAKWVTGSKIVLDGGVSIQ